LDLPSDAKAVIESCSALLLLLFHIALRDGASDLVLNKRLGECRIPLSLPAAPRQHWRSGCQLPLALRPSCRDAGVPAQQQRRTGRKTQRGIWRAGAAPRERGIASEESSSKRNIKASEMGRELAMTDLV